MSRGRYEFCAKQQNELRTERTRLPAGQKYPIFGLSLTCTRHHLKRNQYYVGERGLEPPPLARRAPKARVSTISPLAQRRTVYQESTVKAIEESRTQTHFQTMIHIPPIKQQNDGPIEPRFCISIT